MRKPFVMFSPHLPRNLLVLASMLTLTACAKGTLSGVPDLDLSPEPAPMVPKKRTDEGTAVYLTQFERALENANGKLEAAAIALRKP